MNYRHHFHAGNFADVFKHVWLTRILVYLFRKEARLRYIETHAGAGLYDLGAEAAARTSEWRGGIGRLLSAQLSPACRDLLAPYLNLVEPPAAGVSSAYRGSPLVAQALLRPQDRMTACELHPQDFATLRASLGRDPRVKAVEIDGYVGLDAFLPPMERRGLVLIDPPFEDAREFDRLALALARAHAKWATGIYAVWYPLKGRHGDAALCLAPAGAGPDRRLWIELRIAAGGGGVDNKLLGCGLLVINPPHGLREQCGIVMPELARALGEAGAGTWRVLP